MTHEEILSMLGDYVDYLIANSSAEAPMWNIEKVRSGKPNKWNYIDGCMITDFGLGRRGVDGFRKLF